VTRSATPATLSDRFGVPKLGTTQDHQATVIFVGPCS